MSEGQLVRINKYQSEIAFCSITMADNIIEKGRIMNNEKIEVMGL